MTRYVIRYAVTYYKYAASLDNGEMTLGHGGGRTNLSAGPGLPSREKDRLPASSEDILIFIVCSLVLELLLCI